MQAGYVVLIGKTNVGKSTLVNALVGSSISIVTRKPQTTRAAILGIKTTEKRQMIFMDTPGVHQKAVTQLNKVMNKTAFSALATADVLLWVVDVTQWQAEDEKILQALKNRQVPLVIALNKIDRLNDRQALLPKMAALEEALTPNAMVPISALKKQQLDQLEETLVSYLPTTDHYLLPPDRITNKSERFIAAEMVRQQLMLQLGQELPFSTAVMIDSFQKEKNLLRIEATIYVSKKGQKAIVIGDKGERIKSIGQVARQRLEKFFHQPVFLGLWVKVKANWVDDQTLLAKLSVE